MPRNLPTIVTNDFSFGPGLFYLGVAGTTPTADIGAITEDGITVEISIEKRHIRQGNPKLIEYTFSQAQDAMLKVNGIQWDQDLLLPALGAGTTTSSAAADYFQIGGDPLVTQMAVMIEHQMAITGNTLYVYGWKAVASEGISIQFGHDEHQFPYSYTCQRSATDWAGTTLAYNKQLLAIKRVKQ
jgi:hypothetical protein